MVLRLGEVDASGRVPIVLIGEGLMPTDLQIELSGVGVRGITAHASLTDIGKSVYAHTNQAGRTTILVTGFSQEPLPAGVIGWIELDSGRLESLAVDRVLGVDGAGRAIEMALAEDVTAVTAEWGLPDRFALDQNYPNPFNPVTTIDYALPRSGAVRLSIYDLGGQRVRLLVDGWQLAGRHQAVWDGRDHAGREAANGLYFSELATSGFRAARKMVLIR